jgi:thiamine pyrophosphokinase
MSSTEARSDPSPTSAKRGPGRPRAQPLEEQRRQVLDAARAVFAQHGYHGATIEAIARGSGTPRPTVYELFGTKDDLFAAVVDDSADRVVARLSASFTESEEWGTKDFVRHNFAAVFELFEQDRDAVTVLLNAEQGSVDRPTSAPGEVRRRVLQEISAFTRTRWDVFGVDVGDAAEIMALMFFRMAEGLAMRHADDPGWNREAFIDLLTEFTLGGIDRLWVRAQDVLVAAGRRSPPGGTETPGRTETLDEGRSPAGREPGPGRAAATDRVVVVVAGGGPPAVPPGGLGELGRDPLVVAADSGLVHADTLGLTVDHVVGDMDSVEPAVLDAAARSGVRVDRHPAAKDATDLDLALDVALAAEPRRIVVVTGEGDRFDHALAVALTVSAPRLAGVAVEAWVGDAHLWVVRDRAELAGRPGALVSLLPLHGAAHGVSTTGLRYPLDDEDLAAATSRGVSNEWEAEVATVRLRSGVLVAVAPGAGR